jgi:NADH:ubiquinone oxidoreductase subunit K
MTSVFFTLGAFLFAAGLFVVLSRRNGVMILLGVELMLNASTLNFIHFGRLHDQADIGQATAVFVLVTIAASAAVSMAILLLVYKRHKTVEINELRSVGEPN